jgi:hypothetical protein
MPLPIEERLAALHEHYVSQINASVARGRLDLVRELVDEYEDESLHLMLSSGDGTVRQLSHEPAEILEFGSRTRSGRGVPRADRFCFWRRTS